MSSIKRMATSKQIRGRTSLPLFPADPRPIGLAEAIPASGARVQLESPQYSSGVNTNLFDLASEAACKGSVTPSLAYPHTVEAGKNSYTYDAHTYHTKVPPAGIVTLMEYYLPDGGLVLDPFCGSGMTGVAARLAGLDSALIDISPAATFIAHSFTSVLNAEVYTQMWKDLLSQIEGRELELYATTCRECGKSVPALYYTWAYDIACPRCQHCLNVWEVARHIGKTVRESKILASIECPRCGLVGRKGAFSRRTPRMVEVGYKCCGPRQKERIHIPSERDIQLSTDLELGRAKIPYWYPKTELPPGVNLNQPRKHGLTSVDSFYSGRNLTALAELWCLGASLSEPILRQFALFTLTSLYQRITKLAEFRFWGGSGNMARFNVPYIFNELNVYAAVERKVNTISWHLKEIEGRYRGRAYVSTQSATDLSALPSNCVDFIFTDPPFGASINYSEMNILWEAWLGVRTDVSDEAIINRYQGKGPGEYGSLIRSALRECWRVLKSEHWMCLLFHNSSAQVWNELRNAVVCSGFQIRSIQIFDKKHATFKQLISDNTVGYDLLLHCWKPGPANSIARQLRDHDGSLGDFLRKRNLEEYKKEFMHVRRDPELDYKRLYSEWLSEVISQRPECIVDFAAFRKLVDKWLDGSQPSSSA